LRSTGDDLRWNLGAIATQVDEGICRAAAIATEGVCSIAVDGWAVDYVRLDANGSPLEEPFCYRDERTVASELALHQRIPPERMRELTGVQLLRINTVYQQFADRMKGVPEGQLWLNLPEYMLHRWGGESIAEYTNATHTQMVELGRMAWCDEIFRAAGLSRNSAPRIVPPGTVVGRLTGPLAAVPGLAEVQLIAPACHDTASAVAGIPAAGADWAYLSSGTWSLIGISLDWPLAHEETARQNYTNLAGAGGRFCFHRNVNGMWLLRQCMAAWSEQGPSWEIVELIEAASAMPKPDGLLNVDEPELWLAGEMPARINRQRIAAGLPAMDEGPAGAAAMASLIFHSLAARYAEVLRQIEEHSGRRLKRLYVVGGGSQNALLNRLTAEATGLEVIRGVPESSTLGNFAVQLATLEGHRSKERGADADRVAHWAGLLNRVSV
jgi:rhamnulokinase